MRAAAMIHQNLRRPAKLRDHNILPAIIIEVAKSRAPRGHESLRARIHALKMSVTIHRQQWQFEVVKRGINFLDIIEHVPLRNKQILPAVVVEIFESDSPTGTTAGKGTESRLQTAITEIAFAVIVIDAVNFAW